MTRGPTRLAGSPRGAVGCLRGLLSSGPAGGTPSAGLGEHDRPGGGARRSRRRRRGARRDSPAVPVPHGGVARERGRGCPRLRLHPRVRQAELHAGHALLDEPPEPCLGRALVLGDLGHGQVEPEVDRADGAAAGRHDRAALEVVGDAHPPTGTSKCVWTSTRWGSRGPPAYTDVDPGRHVEVLADRRDRLALDRDVRAGEPSAPTTVPPRTRSTARPPDPRVRAYDSG